MSERGSFCTEYIYCDACYDAAKLILARVAVSVVPDGERFIAGMLRGGYAGEEIAIIKRAGDDLAKVLCHDLRIAVLAEDGEAILTIRPDARHR